MLMRTGDWYPVEEHPVLIVVAAILLLVAVWFV